MTQSDTLQFALHYAKLGYPVLPCKPFEKRPATRNGVKDATTDPDQLAKWFADGNPNLALSAAGLVVVDLDSAEHPWTLNEWPAGPTARTPRGGWHRFFKRPAGLEVSNWNGVLAEKVDLKTDGGYVLVAPSQVRLPASNTNPAIDGEYRWVYQLGSREQLPEPPEWLLELIAQHRPRTASGPEQSQGNCDTSTVMERAQLYLAKCEPSVNGNRGHDAALWAARVLVRGFLLPDDQAWPLLVEWNESCSPPWSSKELHHKLKEARTKPFSKPDGWLLNCEAERPSTSSRPKPERNSQTEPERKAPEWPDPPDDAAFYGLAGEIVRFMAPDTEANPVALLVQLLVMFGNLIGREPYFPVSSDKHRTNLFAVLVGPTSTGRKGLSLSNIREVFDDELGGLDANWLACRCVGNLSTSEGLINQLRDANSATEDPGEPDKRLMATEREFSSILTQFERDGNTLSQYIRDLWDSPELLKPLTKSNIIGATRPHFSILGHITPTELQQKLTSSEVANGFANRFLYVCVRRPLAIANPPPFDPVKLAQLREQLREAAGFAQNVNSMKWHSASVALWESVYPTLSDDRPGLLGELAARAAPIVIRLAMLFALLDRTREVYPCHLLAAVALWDYGERSLAYLFGERSGDRQADEVLAMLQAVPTGMTLSEITKAMGNHLSGERLGSKLELLNKTGQARSEAMSTGGRSAQRWFAIPRVCETVSLKILKVELAKCEVIPVIQEPGRPFVPPVAAAPSWSNYGHAEEDFGDAIPNNKPSDQPSQEEIFLVNLLRAGPRLVEEIEATRKKAGFGSLTKTAKKLNLVRRETRRGWEWSLPGSFDLSKYPEPIPEPEPEPATLLDDVPEPPPDMSATEPPAKKRKASKKRKQAAK